MKRFASVSLLIFSMFAVAGEWSMESGKVYFTSTKNGNAPVPGVIAVSGSMHDGKVFAEVDLNSLDTQNPPRDTNIKTVLFDVENHPVMRLTGEISIEPPAEIGEVAHGEVKAEIAYRGQTVAMMLPVTLVRTGENTLHMQSGHTAVTLESLGLAGGPVAALIKICAHASVEPLVFVSMDGSWTLN